MHKPSGFLIIFLAAWLGGVFVPAGLADDLYTRPQLNAAGDYLSNGGPIQGQVSGHMHTPGALWQVVVPGLNCRAAPDVLAKRVRRFGRGTILQANLGFGGSDEVLYNAQDSRGRTWMPVRSQQGQDLKCYVRANRRYLRPLK